MAACTVRQGGLSQADRECDEQFRHRVFDPSGQDMQLLRSQRHHCLRLLGAAFTLVTLAGLSVAACVWKDAAYRELLERAARARAIQLPTNAMAPWSINLQPGVLVERTSFGSVYVRHGAESAVLIWRTSDYLRPISLRFMRPRVYLVVDGQAGGFYRSTLLIEYDLDQRRRLTERRLDPEDLKDLRPGGQ
jgi:hypothetical protein